MHRGQRNTYDGKIAGLYDLEETLGRGHFAVVKLARHVFTGEKVAVKVIDKTKLDDVSRAHLFQEVRCMKLVQHPNVVRLYEVIDTQTKLYLILELGDGGDMYDYIMRHEGGLGEEQARKYFRQIVHAISYCHRLHVVHRDLKPENVVFFEKLGMVKLTDFGFSNRFCPGQKLETSCGSLAYSAPEILLGDSYDAPAVDVWSLGVILYMLVCGQAPFQEANDSETLTMIMDCKYTIPVHVSEACKRLIAKMLIREPERRATLEEIANDPWLAEDCSLQPAEFLPLISREHVSDEDHAHIIQKMVNGKIATKEEILEALDKNEYNHITATYFLLAERKLRAHRQEQAQLISQGQPPDASAPSSGKSDESPDSTLPLENESQQSNKSLLTISRTPGDAPQNYRARKCSIVQEEDDEDDITHSGHEELVPPHAQLSRRGSRSEGRLNIAVLERIAEAERSGAEERKKGHALRDDNSMKMKLPQTTKLGLWMAKTPTEPLSSNSPAALFLGSKWKSNPQRFTIPPAASTVSPSASNTSLSSESSQNSVPTYAPTPMTPVPKFKTMPSPTRPLHSVCSSPQLTLNEIFEEGDNGEPLRPSQTGAVRRGFVTSLHHNHTAPGSVVTRYERRQKFSKTRTTSCSSSDASDDDSENRKKRAHKLKSLPKRDSHDDSSDSQDPSGGGSGGGGGVGGGHVGGAQCGPAKPPSGVPDGSHPSSGGSSARGQSKGSSERRHCMHPFRQGAGETRLRESQSLNRITEIQETETTVQTHVQYESSSSSSPRFRCLSTKLFGRPFGKRPTSSGAVLESRKCETEKSNCGSDSCTGRRNKHVNRIPKNGCVESIEGKGFVSMSSISVRETRVLSSCEEKENRKILERVESKKVRLAHYFQMHRKLCLPLFRGRLYKAQSCSSIKERALCDTYQCTNEKWCNGKPETFQVNGPIVGVSPTDINQNLGLNKGSKEANGGRVTLVTCPVGHVHDSSKCCSLC